MSALCPPAPHLLWRARLRLAALSLLVMGSLLYAAGFAMGRLLLHKQDQAIRQELRSLAGTLHDSLKPALPRDARSSDALAAALPGLCLGAERCPPPTDLIHRHAISVSDSERYRVRVLDPSGRLIASTPGHQQMNPEPARLGWVLSGDARGRAGPRWAFYTIHLHHSHGPGEPIWGYLQISRSLSDLDSEADQLWWVGHGVFLLALLGIAAASWWLAGLAMAPMVEAYRRQEQFSADVAHELRTPLANLLALVETERCLRAAGGDRSGLDRALAQGRRLQQLIADLLLLASLQRRSAQPQSTLCDLNELVTDVLEDLGEAAAASEVSLHVAMPTPGIRLPGDGPELCRLLINLLTNAIQHTPAGGRVDVTLEREGKDCVLTISDTGPGIPSHQQSLIFERFTRLDPARSRQQGGAGLGLAIAQAIARRHGGAITLHSTPGEGADFRVRLPAVC